MRIIGLTDIHGRIINFDKLLRYKPDAILISGDFTKHSFVKNNQENNQDDFFKKNLKLLEFLKNLNNSVKIFLIPGNWDDKETIEKMNEFNLNIDEKILKIDDLFLIGIGGSNITPINSPNEYSEEEIYLKFLNAIKGFEQNIKNKFILLTHAPPKNTMADRSFEGHVGSLSIRKIIEEFKPVLCVCGHIHESRCIDKLGKSLIVNPSSIGFFIYDTKSKNLEIYDL
ncbi:metallophosphoesterase [Methanococcus vannielii SB]|uniref:Metallophosphoesterase n=1 Tax=Methanococcus vannielii (strain ATCC 35089 / DSM 1224 / JCM 13029 / OCM 148 / SB) TaxID=406327 RepID=A6UQW5_METVS|nr:metallophosphoesterase [Methanococcus vannielii]ABR54887.1 metallophosphoesterase [Methanococcus vannielii SB]